MTKSLNNKIFLRTVNNTKCQKIYIKRKVIDKNNTLFFINIGNYFFLVQLSRIPSLILDFCANEEKKRIKNIIGHEMKWNKIK